MRERFASVLAGFEPATAELLASRQLLRRADTKFVTSPAAIAEIVANVGDAYAVVPVGDDHIATYANIYFDTADLRCFHDHRRGRRLRQKIRIRSYPDRGLAYLELKSRRNELHTDKSRIAVPYGTGVIDPANAELLAEQCEFARALHPVVEIEYRRIMLAGIDTNERVTVDLGVTIDHDDDLAISGVAIVEVKQPSRCNATPIMRAIRDAGNAPCSLSKYVAAIAARGDVRANRLRPVLRRVERIAHR